MKMTTTPDFTKMFQDMFSGKMGDMKAVNDMVKDAAEFGAKFNKIALETAEKNAELSTAWVKESLGKYSAFTKVQGEPADYAKVVSEVVSAQAQATPEHVAKFAEVAKSAQMATVELMMAAGKDFQNEVVKTAKTATKAA
jgi:phage-related protein